MNGNFPLLLSKINEFTQKFYLNKLLRGLIYASSVLLLFYLLLFTLVYYLHPGVGVKTFLFFSFVLAAIVAVYFWILRPAMAYFRLSRTLSIEEAAALIGDHFFNVKDKLLNTLQLQILADQHPEENALILAGIEQKITELRPIPFSSAIRLQENRKYLKYLAAPVILILFIALIFPAVLSEGTYSLVRYDKEILPKAPFNFELLNKTLSIVQGEDLDLQLKLTGDELPYDVYVTVGENTHKLSRESASRFNYSIKNVQQSSKLRFSAGGFESSSFVIDVIPRASLISLTALVEYPNYLRRKKEVLQNAGDMTLPEGSRVSWKFSSENSSHVFFRLGQTLHKLPVEDNRSKFSAEIRKSIGYKIMPVNARAMPSDSIFHQIRIIPDAQPSISVTVLTDSLSRKALYFSGRIADDYGFSGLKFHYEVKENGRLLRYADRLISIKKTALEQPFFHFWNLNEVAVEPGQVVEYYFEVADNDGVNGAKKVRSAVATYQPPTIPELLKELDKSSSILKDKMGQAIKLAEQVEKESKKLAQGLLDKKQLTFEDKKQIDALLDKRKQLEKSVEEIKKLNEKNAYEKEENQVVREELAEKQRQIDDLFNNVLDEKTKALLEQLQKLMDENNKDQTRDELSNMQMDNKSLRNELDRILELYKQLEFEQNLQNNIDQLKEMASAQRNLSKANKTAASELKEKQQDISRQFDELKKSFEDLERKNNDLERPNPFENPKDDLKKIDDLQQKSEQQLDKNQQENAREHQQKAADEMQSLAKKMEEMQQQSSEMEANINLNELRRLLGNLLSTSFEQEKVMLAIKNMAKDDPSYTRQVQKQGIIKDNMKTIGDSLYALSKRVPQIESTVNEEMQQIRFNIDKSLEHLAERRTQDANKTQQYAMTSVNNLALMLNEALEQLQNSRKKGGKGKGKQGMQQLQQMQQQLNKKMQEARSKMQEQGNKGTVPKGKMSEEFARMAQEQQMIREALQKLNQQENKDGSGKLGDLNKAIQDMKKTEAELVNKRLAQETLDRQKDVLTKLLDAENAEREQDQSEKRESKAGAAFPPSYKKMLEQYDKLKKGETEWLQKLPPDMNYYYKNKIAEYFKLLNSPR